jgi:hypothetical protein
MVDLPRINTGTVSNDGTGDTLKSAGTKINEAFETLETLLDTDSITSSVNAAAGSATAAAASQAAIEAIEDDLVNGGALAVAHGGTGSATAALARTALGLAIGTDVQAYDAQLADLAGLTVTKGNIAVANGSNWVALGVGTDGKILTADAASAAGIKWETGGVGGGAPADATYLTLGTNATLSVERVLTAGTNISFTDAGAGSTLTVAISDAELNALAGLTSAADKVPYFTGSGTASVADFSSVARTLVAQTSQANMRSTGLGLGTASVLAETTTAEYLANTSARALSTDKVNAAGALFGLTDGANIAWDMASGFNASVTLGGNRTLSNPTNTIVGRTGAIVVTQDGTGTRTLAYGTNWEAAGGSFPVLSTAASSKDVIFYWIQSSTSIIITGILKAVV